MEDDHIMAEFVAFQLNKKRGFFSRKIKPLEVLDIFKFGQAPQGFSVSDAILAAKTFCKVAGSVCPYVEKLP